MKLATLKRRSLLAALIPASLLASSLAAGTINTTDTKIGNDAAAPKEQSIFDKIWGLTTIYKNNENPIIEELDLTGRFQIDYFNVSSSRGNNDFFEIRRFRLGEDSWWASRHLELKAELDTNLRSFGAPEEFYYRFTDLYAVLRYDDTLNLKVGRFQSRFGYDHSMSDTQLLTFERGSIDDLVYNSNDYDTGVAIFGKIGNWFYQASVFSLDVQKEFSNFDGGQAYTTSLSYDFSQALNAKKALLSLDYFHSDPNKNADAFKNYRNGVAAYFDYKKGPFGLVTELAWLDGRTSAITNGDVYGLVLQPHYDITDKLQVVLRYQLDLAEKDNGVAITNRQEKTVGTYTGDTLNSAYLGLNYYIYGHKLKLMAGEQYTNLSGGAGAKAGYNGWTTIVGLRMYW